MAESNGVLYLEIYNDIVNKIKSGEYREGDKMPTERDMCTIYGVSRITIRQAFALLEEKGYLLRKQGKGSFIKRGRFNQNLSKLYSLRNDFKHRGLIHYTHIVSFESVHPDILVCHYMDCSPEDLVYKLVRIFYVDNIPYTIETNYIPQNLFSEPITVEMIQQNGLYNTLSSFHYPPTNATEKLRIALPAKAEAAALQCKTDDACMLIHRITYSNNTLIEFSTNLVKGDIFEYTVHL